MDIYLSMYVCNNFRSRDKLFVTPKYENIMKKKIIKFHAIFHIEITVIEVISYLPL